MTDQERLELIKDREKDAMYLLRGTMIRSDWRWLIDRVEELETAIKGAQDIAKIQAAHIEELESRLEIMGTTLDQEVMVSQRYKRALEFYASAHKYTQPVEPNSVMSIIDMDSGLRAREALEGK